MEDFGSQTSQRTGPGNATLLIAPPLNGGFPNLGYLFGGPHNKDYSMLGSILGSPYIGKLPNGLIGVIPKL